MAKSKTKFFEIIVSQARQNFEVDIVLREHLRVLAEAKSFEPLGDVTQGGPPRDVKRLSKSHDPRKQGRQ
ncbi:MAG TPA: hypothetical protein VI251_08740 [Pseudolabrys sp.]|jgi:hypothetical protein